MYLHPYTPRYWDCQLSGNVKEEKHQSTWRNWWALHQHWCTWSCHQCFSNQKWRKRSIFWCHISWYSIKSAGSPNQQMQLSTLHKACSPVELTNCEVKASGQGQGYDIILKSNTQIRLPPRKIDMATIMASSTQAHHSWCSTKPTAIRKRFPLM